MAHDADDASDPAPHASAGKIAAVLGAAALVPLIPFAVIGELPGEQWLQASGLAGWRFGLSAATLLSADLLLPIPSSIVGAMLGGRLGFAAGFAGAWLGLTAGHLLGYGLGRLAPARWGGQAPAAPTAAIVFLSRPVPVLAEAVTLAAGVHRAPALPFALSCAMGNALYAGAMAANGAALLPRGLAGPGLILPMLVPVGSWALWRRWRARTGAPER